MRTKEAPKAAAREEWRPRAKDDPLSNVVKFAKGPDGTRGFSQEWQAGRGRAITPSAITPSPAEAASTDAI